MIWETLTVFILFFHYFLPQLYWGLSTGNFYEVKYVILKT